MAPGPTPLLVFYGFVTVYHCQHSKQPELLFFAENHFLSSLTSYDPSGRFAKIPDLLAYQKAATSLQFQHFVTFDLRYPKYIMNKMPKPQKKKKKKKNEGQRPEPSNWRRAPNW